jgi:hypothetical protein
MPWRCQPLDGFPSAHPVRRGGSGGRPCPSQAEKDQAQKARWLSGGASDRAGLLRTAQGQKALERSPSGRSFRQVGVRRGANLSGVGPAHSQKSDLKPWLSGEWSIPPKQNAEFVWRMEDVLEVYTRPYDERFPQVCLDEKSKQLVGEVREPLAASAGRVARHETTSTSARGRPTSSSFPSPWPAGATSASPIDGRRSIGRIA